MASEWWRPGWRVGWVCQCLEAKPCPCPSPRAAWEGQALSLIHLGSSPDCTLANPLNQWFSNRCHLAPPHGTVDIFRRHFWLSQLGTECCCHLEGRGWGCCLRRKLRCTEQLHTRNHLGRNVSGAEVEETCFRPSQLHFPHPWVCFTGCEGMRRGLVTCK